MKISRRRLLQSVGLGIGSWLGTLGVRPSNADIGSLKTATAPKTPIEHFIVLMQENHTFDNYFGLYPGADGLPPDVQMPLDPSRPDLGSIAPFRLGENDVQNGDPDHGAATHRLQFNGGRMDGFVSALNRRGQDGRLAMAYYDERDLPFYWNLADEYVLFDRFFSSAAAGSFINHVYWVSGSAGDGIDSLGEDGLGDLPTIFDLLEEQGISWKFYVQNYDPKLTYRTASQYPRNRASQVIWAPLLRIPRFLDNPKLSAKIVHLDEYYEDAAAGTLPAVAYIAPSGPSEHPPSSLRSGQSFTRSLLMSLVRSPQWSRSAFVLTYDDWGGWYDHVPPPQVDEFGYGFRVPGLLISPYARRGHIDHTTLDFTSLLKFIEENWDLPSLSTRDAAASSIASAFDFNRPPRERRLPPFEREANSVTKPRTSVVYASYGGVVGALAIGAAFVRSRISHSQETGGERS